MGVNKGTGTPRGISQEPELGPISLGSRDRRGAIPLVKIIATRSGIVSQMNTRLMIFNEFSIYSR
jgi:hypothetical protein